jgi:hypothetical protein
MPFLVVPGWHRFWTAAVGIALTQRNAPQAVIKDSSLRDRLVERTWRQAMSLKSWPGTAQGATGVMLAR